MAEGTGLTARLARKTPVQLVNVLLERLPFRPFELALYYTIRLKGRMHHLPGEASLAVREATEHDLDALVRCVAKRERFAGRFRQGERCLVALAGEEVAGFVWFSVAPLYREELSGFRMPIPGDSVYIYDALVRPEYRQLGVLNQIYLLLYDWMETHGRDTILGLISHDNEVSWRTHFKKGFTPVDKVLYLRILGWRIYRVSPADARLSRWRPAC